MKASEREKAILFVLAAGQLPGGWKDAFILSSQKAEKEVTAQKNITTSAERWRRRPEILKAYESAIKAVQELKEENGQRTAEETAAGLAGDSVRTKPAKAGRIDYYNPDNQRRTINAIIDKAQDDPKTQLDAIKAIQQTQRDDRQAAKDNQIQRYYTPLSCRSCPFKAKAAKKG